MNVLGAEVSVFSVVTGDALVVLTGSGGGCTGSQGSPPVPTPSGAGAPTSAPVVPPHLARGGRQGPLGLQHDQVGPRAGVRQPCAVALQERVQHTRLAHAHQRRQVLRLVQLRGVGLQTTHGVSMGLRGCCPTPLSHTHTHACAHTRIYSHLLCLHRPVLKVENLEKNTCEYCFITSTSKDNHY